MTTIHGTAKAFGNGFIPMIILRNTKGQCVGSRCPEGGYREFRTFTSAEMATKEAQFIAIKIASQYPEVLRAA